MNNSQWAMLTSFLIVVILVFLFGAYCEQKELYAEAIKHHAARYVNNGQSPDVVFRWNDEVK